MLQAVWESILSNVNGTQTASLQCRTLGEALADDGMLVVAGRASANLSQ